MRVRPGMLCRAKWLIDAPPPAPRQPQGWESRQLPQGCLHTGNLRCRISYSLACHHGSCGGPEINALLQRRTLQKGLAAPPEALGQGRRQTQGACSDLRHSSANPFHDPRPAALSQSEQVTACFQRCLGIPTMTAGQAGLSPAA